MTKPGSLSQNAYRISMPFVELAAGPLGGVLTGELTKLSIALGTYEDSATQPLGIDTVKPASTAFATSSGHAIVVYLKGETEDFDDDGETRICYRRSSDAFQTFDSTETCLENDAGTGFERQNTGSAGAGYDPLTDTFLIAWRSNFDQIEIHIFSANPSQTWFGRTTLSNTAVTMPTIACSPVAYGGSPFNCRLVYGAADDYRCLETFQFAVQLPFWINPARIFVGNTHTDCYSQFDTPHVVWWNGDNQYHLAFGQYNTRAYHFTMSPTATYWSYHSTIQSGNYPSDFISGPALASQELCFFGSCGIHKLRAFWLDPPD